MKIEVDNNQNGRSSGISQQTLEDAAGVAGAGGNVDAVLVGGTRPASCSVDDNCRESLESEGGQWPLRCHSWLRNMLEPAVDQTVWLIYLNASTRCLRLTLLSH